MFEKYYEKLICCQKFIQVPKFSNFPVTAVEKNNHQPQKQLENGTNQTQLDNFSFPSPTTYFAALCIYHIMLEF